MSFIDRLVIRNEAVDSVSSWMWPKLDSGTWVGPSWEWELYFKEVILKNCRKFDVVVQAGGACGMYPRLLANMFKYVYTFEPDPFSFHCLVNNCQLENVVKINAALGENHDMISLTRISPENVGMNQIAGPGMIPKLMIDDLNLPLLDLIFLDVELYEKKVIAGAKRTIEQFKPLIICESGSDELLSMLPKGYHVIHQQNADTFYQFE